MTDTLDTPAPAHEPREFERRNTNRILLAVLAAVAITALGMLAILAPIGGDGGHTSMMNNGQMPGPMMDHVQMMDNSMMGHDAPSATVPGARQVRVSATSFSFTPDEIHVRVGEDVTILLTAADIAHDFTIDELDVHVAASPGQTGRGGLHAPSTSGRYTAYCSVVGHRGAGMTAIIVVDSD
jgi:heme/copper-type cytochrome/quinol oxidase subunit 2